MLINNGGLTGCGKTRFCGFCNKGTASAGPQMQQKMMGFSPCGMYFGVYTQIQAFFRSLSSP
jgi:hypothetical protein